MDSGSHVTKQILSFDLTGTLATFKFCDSIYFEGLPQLYSTHYRLSFAESITYLTRCYDDIGDHEVDWYDITYWFERFGLGNGWEDLLLGLSHNIEFYPDAQPVLSKLAQYYELIMVSNACTEFIKVETASIKEHFSQIISCVSDFKEVKKTPEFYLRLCEHIGVGPGEIIHVGDHWDFDYTAPRGAGLQAFYLDRTAKACGENVIHTLHDLESKLI